MSSSPAAKKQKMEEIPEHINALDDNVKKALVEIDDFQSAIDKLNEEASNEILHIEQKYNVLRKPFQEKRTAAIREIPNFWAQAILNHPQLSTIVEEREKELLNAITQLEVEDAEDIKRGFKIRFYFAPNEFIENDKIEKEFILDGTQCSTVTPIKWKEGHSFARGASDAGELTFFQWVAAETDPNSDEIAELIKDDLWPNPVQYFCCPDLGDGDADYDELAEDDDAEEVDDDASDIEN